MPCLRQKAYRQPWPWHREHRKSCDYKKLTKRLNSNEKLTANFEVCIGFQSLHTSCTDFLYPRVKPPSPSPTPHIIDEPPEFLVVGIKHVASWSEVGSQEGSSSHWKEEITVARKSSPNSCAVVIPQQQRNSPQYDGPCKGTHAMTA